MAKNIVSEAEVVTALIQNATISDAHRAVLTLFHDMVEATVRRYLGYNPCYQSHVEIYPVQSLRRRTYSLQLRHLPVRRVTEVVVDYDSKGGQASGAFTSANNAETYVAGTDYYVDFEILPATIGGTNGLDENDGLSRKGTLTNVVQQWPAEPGTVKVSYVAGYTDRELRGQGDYHEAATIRKATLEALIANFQRIRTQAAGIKKGRAGAPMSESLGDYSYTLDAASAAMSNFAVELPASTLNALRGHVSYGRIGL